MSRSSGRTIDRAPGQVQAADEVGATSDDGDRQSRRLALHQIGRSGDLVGDARHGDDERAALGIRPAAQILEHVHSGGPDRGVGLAFAPCAAEGVRHDHADLDAEQRPQARREGAGRGIRIHRQQQHGAVGSVRGIDPGGGRHDAEAVLHDARGAAVRSRTTRHDSHGLGGDGLLAIVGGERAALGFRDDLRRHHEDVAICQRAGRCIRDHAHEISAGGDLGNALESPGLQHVALRQRANRTSVSVSPRNGSVWAAPSAAKPLRT